MSVDFNSSQAPLSLITLIISEVKLKKLAKKDEYFFVSWGNILVVLPGIWLLGPLSFTAAKQPSVSELVHVYTIWQTLKCNKQGCWVKFSVPDKIILYPLLQGPKKHTVPGCPLLMTSVATRWHHIYTFSKQKTTLTNNYCPEKSCFIPIFKV